MTWLFTLYAVTVFSTMTWQTTHYNVYVYYDDASSFHPDVFSISHWMFTRYVCCRRQWVIASWMGAVLHAPAHDVVWPRTQRKTLNRRLTHACAWPRLVRRLVTLYARDKLVVGFFFSIRATSLEYIVYTCCDRPNKHFIYFCLFVCLFVCLCLFVAIPLVF